jgi:hypothetical protein
MAFCSTKENLKSLINNTKEKDAHCFGSKFNAHIDIIFSFERFYIPFTEMNSSHVSCLGPSFTQLSPTFFYTHMHTQTSCCKNTFPRKIVLPREYALYFPFCILFVRLHNKLNQHADTGGSSWCIIPLTFPHLQLKRVFQSIGEKSIVKAKFTLFHQVEVNARVLWPRKLLSFQGAHRAISMRPGYSASFFGLLITKKNMTDSVV